MHFFYWSYLIRQKSGCEITKLRNWIHCVQSIFYILLQLLQLLCLLISCKIMDELILVVNRGDKMEMTQIAGFFW